MNSPEILPTLVIGAGVLGAAMAHTLTQSGHSVIVLEAEKRAGEGISSRNSGVIHAGIYYPPKSLKAEWCQRGNRLLYAFVQENAVPFSACGKLIVANQEAEYNQLLWLKDNALPIPLGFTEWRPHGLQARWALFSPSTGIVDPIALVQRLLETSQAEVLYNQEVSHLRVGPLGVELEIEGTRYCAQRVVNCAGLNAPLLAQKPPHFLAKGSYFQVTASEFQADGPLVYPAIPKHSPSLGIHLTRNTAGQWLLGPDIEWVETENYGVDPARQTDFFRAAVRYLPWLKMEQLQPAYAGIRPKRFRDQWADFLPVFEGEHQQLVHFLGYESPGLTSALAAAEMLADHWR
ncbi:MAG: FAD-dependent oxidoreductase [Acidobacteria bacterium]|nr:FAD-dependent oxidoreductase [Acidobacteriota bacterium]MCB9398903.1 FAD-dependent oxidoreductase [Acidobacteriota bacterium]